MSAATLHFVLPDGVDDPARPSGGNRYDRRVSDGLVALGWSVREHKVPGCWPHPTGSDLDALAAVLDCGSEEKSGNSSAGISIGTSATGSDKSIEYDVILIDGLIASAAGNLVAEVARGRPVVTLIHMPFGSINAELRQSEERMVRSVAGAVVTSQWTARYLVGMYGLDSGRVFVIPPGVDPAHPATRQADGGRLICVAAVTHAKGYDVLLSALADIGSRPGLVRHPWRCTCVGALNVEPEAAARFQVAMRSRSLADRVHFSGPLTGAALDAAFGAADLLVLPSRSETWGMVITEALARGIPVVASDVGGVPEALGVAPDGSRPGILVPAADPLALADAVERWLTDPDERSRLRHAASARRATLASWSQSAQLLSAATSAASRGFATDASR
ncbi:MAG: glycosyltransferase family 4 protein [Nakamurella sp.]